MKIPRTKSFIILSLVVLLTLTVTAPAFAQTLEQSKAAKQQAQQEVQNLQQKLENSVERYNYACVQLEETRAKIGEMTVELRKANARLAADRARLNLHARAMYVNGPSEFISVLVNARNFDDFLVGLDFKKRVGQQDAELISEVKAARSRLQGISASLRGKEAEQQKAREEIVSAKAAVEADLSSAKGKLANMQAQEQQIQQAMARAAAEANARAAAVAVSSSSNSSGSRSSTSARVMAPVRPPAGIPPSPHGGVVGVAYAQLGKPYVWGAAGPNAFDCSGLVMYCYMVGAGISLPHSSYAQANCGTPVSVSELQPGDILGFRGWGHVGLYIGGGEFIQAPHSGDVVKITALSTRGDFCGAVRP
jgi:peptidoglycan DL-endopeptidase CwlO